MSDTSGGPGWWQASDGKWYPPHLQPGPAPVADPFGPPPSMPGAQPGPFGGTGPAPWVYTPTPTPTQVAGPPPKPGFSGGAIAVMAIVAVALVLVIVVAVGALLGSDAKTSSTTLDSCVGDCNGGESASGAVPAGWVPYVDPDGSFRISFPSDWMSVPLSGDVSAVGEKVAPGDPTLAAAIDQAVTVLPRVIVLYSFPRADTGVDAFQTNFNLIPAPRASGETLDSIAAAIPAQLQGLGATGVDIQRVTVGDTPAVEATYSLGVGQGVSGVQFYILDSAIDWVLTFTSDEPAYSADFATIAGSFVPT